MILASASLSAAVPTSTTTTVQCKSVGSLGGQALEPVSETNGQFFLEGGSVAFATQSEACQSSCLGQNSYNIVPVSLTV
jgi:hypothetical protein